MYRPNGVLLLELNISQYSVYVNSFKQGFGKVFSMRTDNLKHMYID